MSTEQALPDPGPGRQRLDIPPEWDDPPPITAEELREMETKGVSLDEIIRVIEAEGT
ncbi:MAG TPA: hypothetical protein VH092_08000 [Urbifossiella sp.]|jgi:hypothetical protein|nr:hypothetical protein [Urbifossiella sp.]